MIKLAPNFRIITLAICLIVSSNSLFSQNQDINIPESGNLGNVAINVSTDFVFTIQNTHSGGNPANNQLNITGITLSGTHASEFVVSGISFPVTINRAASISFTITFTPTASGTRTAVLSVASDDPDENPYDLNLSGYGDATLTSLVLTNTFSLNVLEPSGLAFDKNNNQLFTVSDNTNLIYRLSLTGTILETLSYSGSDLEGVSMYTTNKLLVAEEGSRELVEYDYVNDVFIASHTMSYSTTDLSPTGDNSRIEGVTYDSANDVIYFLNEKNPGGLIKANGSFSVTNEYPLNYAGDYSGSHYVEETGELWLASDQESTIYKCNTDGTIIQSFPITTSGGSAINKLEGIAIDYTNQLLYAVSDAGQELYVFDINDPTLSIANTDLVENTIHLFPNPATDYLNIKLNNLEQLKKVNVYNTLGKLINTINIDSPNLNISALNSGMYFLEIETNTNTYSKTIIVKK